MTQSSEVPLCPICCDWLGKYGGPCSLPCGHNGCLECLQHVQQASSAAPACPLCRTDFSRGLTLAVNTELRDLIALATAALLDDKTRDDFDVFPSAQAVTEHYAQGMASAQQQLSFAGCYPSVPPAGNNGQHPQQQPQQQGSGSGWRSYPSVPPPLLGSNNSSLAAAAAAADAAGRVGPHPGLASLLPAGTNSSSSNGSGAIVAAQQYHAAFHQHPGLPTSAPSGSAQGVLQWDPPQWLPDSFAQACGQCHAPFKPLLRLRHHCRLCGKVFCDACSARRLLLPPRFRERSPQRVCELCAALLEPLQPFLIAATAAAAQPPVHDIFDSISLRSWLNSPWGSSMQDELYKAANIARAFVEALRPQLERGVPASLLSGMRGVALLSVARVGAGWSATVGSGLVIARQRGSGSSSGAWSAPCAVSCCGAGWGAALGAQLTDVLLVLRTDEAVRAFAAGHSLGVGGAAGLTVGPLGRTAEASYRLGGLASRGAVVGFSCSKGAFAGVALEGSLTSVRDAVNRAFYGWPVTARALLLDGAVAPPPAAALLYRQLDRLMHLWEAPPSGSAVATSSSSAAALEQAERGARSMLGAGSRELCSPRTASAAADCRAASTSAATVGVSSSWDVVGGAAAAAGALAALGLSEEEEDEDSFEAALAAAALAGGRSSDSDDQQEHAASAPPAPSSMLYGLFSPSSSNRRTSSTANPQPPAAAAIPVQPLQHDEDDEEEPQYVLEW